jgi:D-amino-acid dehydrogenase
MARKVIVVGAGLAGCCTAFALERYGADVVLIDRMQGPGEGASLANGGMLTPSMADPWNAPGVWRDLLRWLGREDAPMLLRIKAFPSLARWGLSFLAASRPDHYGRAVALNARLGLYSLSVMQRWRDAAAPSYDHACRGTIKFYRDAATFRAGQAKARDMAELGIETRALDPAEAVALQPALAPIADALAGAVHFPRDETGDAHAFVQALTDHAQSGTLACHWNCEVSNLIEAGGRLVAIRLSNGEEIEGDAVVLATGAHVPALAREAGVRLPVRPAKGYSITYPHQAATGQSRLTLPIIDDALHAAVTPLGDRIRVAGTAEFAGFDARIQRRRITNLESLLRRILPKQAAELKAMGGTAWVGFRPMHARGFPAIGAAGLPGLYVNAGHGHLGWTLAAGSGEALAREILGLEPEIGLSAYAP